MDRRQMLTTTALGMGGFVVGTGFAAPACPGGVSKEKVVKVAELVIELSKQSTPLLNLLGAKDIAITVETKVIPALEKLRDALADADIPTSQSMLANVRSVLSSVRQGLANLPESPRLLTVMGIIASVNMLLLTVEAFIESESPASAASDTKARSMKPSANADAIKRAYEASWL